MSTMALVDQRALLAGPVGLVSRNGRSFLFNLEGTAENIPSSGSPRPIFKAPGYLSPHPHRADNKGHRPKSEEMDSPPLLPHPGVGEGGLPLFFLGSHPHTGIPGTRTRTRARVQPPAFARQRTPALPRKQKDYQFLRTFACQGLG